jgi:hypothetical protein
MQRKGRVFSATLMQLIQVASLDEKCRAEEKLGRI